MGLKTYLAGALIAVAVGSVIGWHRAKVKEAEQRVRAEQLVEDLERAKREAAARDSAHAAEVERLKAANASLEEDLALAERVADRRVAELPQHLAVAREAGTPDSTVRRIQETVDAVTEESEICSLALRACNDVVGAQEMRIADLLSARTEQDSLVVQLGAISVAPQASKRPIPDWAVAAAALLLAAEKPGDAKRWVVVGLSGINALLRR